MTGLEPEPGGDHAVPAGWYPDPGGSGKLLYWDGSRWTGHVHDAVEHKRVTSRSRRGSAPKLLLGGGVALAISPFLPWVKVILLGDLSLFQLFAAAGHSDALAWGAVLGGGATAALAWTQGGSPAARGTALAVGILGGALALYALIGMRNELSEAHGLVTIGIGPYVSVAGCVAMVAGGLRIRRARGSGEEQR